MDKWSNAVVITFTSGLAIYTCTHTVTQLNVSYITLNDNS